MSETFDGTVTIEKSGGGDVNVTLNGDSGDVTLGGVTQDGDLKLLDRTGVARIHLNGSSNNMAFNNATGQRIANLGSNGNLTLGGTGSDGDLAIKDSTNQTRINFDGDNQRLRMFTSSGNQIVSLGDNGNLTLGGTGMDGDLAIKDASGRNRITLDGDNQRLRIYTTSGNRVVSLGDNGNLTLGGEGMDGDLVLRDPSGNDTISMNGEFGNLVLGGAGQDGDLTLKDAAGNNSIHLDGNQANLFMGGNGRDGDIALFASSENNPDDDAGKATIHLNGNAGDIILRNADCAEEFSVAPTISAEPGDVMVLDEDGLLRPCERAYDKATIGVISGADMYKPGIILDRQEGLENRSPIALVGKVCVHVTDQNGPIKIGDLLTTSDSKGHAMKASDQSKAFGAVIGKALSNHDAGDGMIPIVIALQ